MDVLFLFVMHLIGMFIGVEAAEKEYCSTETFKAECRGNDVILMRHAVYGRMRIGRCVKSDLGFLGCSADVMSIADSYCSGLSSCEIVIPNGEMNKMVECNPELSRYLEASFICVSALPPIDKCVSSVTVSVSSQPSHLSSSLSVDSPCGRRDAPWILKAAPGQTINLTMYDFYWDQNKQPSGRYEAPQRGNNRQCLREYGQILDPSNKHNTVPICGGPDRVTHLYRSAGHQVQVVVSSKYISSARFLIQYHAVGCPDLVKPNHAWTQRSDSGDELVVGCEATRQTWHLKCVKNRWVGVIGNCTQYLPNTLKTGEVKDRGYMSYPVVVILVIIAIAGAISLVIITIGIICYKRMSRHNKQLEAHYQCSTYKTKTKQLYNVGDDVETYHKQYDYNDQQQTTYPKNEYTHIWDQQGSPCLLDADVIHSQNQPTSLPPPTHDAPLLPKSRSTHVRRNNNNNSDLFLDLPPPPVLNGGGEGRNTENEANLGNVSQDILCRGSVSDSTGSASTGGLSKYYMLDKPL